MKNSLILLLMVLTQACSPLGPMATVPHASGIVTSTIPGVAQIEVLTLMGTDKTIMDHVISLSSGKNCSAVNIEKGQYYCAEDEPVINQNIFCYNTLGSPTCYKRPDPYRAKHEKLGQNEHNLIRKRSSNSP
mgnify:FL=1